MPKKCFARWTEMATADLVPMNLADREIVGRSAARTGIMRVPVAPKVARVRNNRAAMATASAVPTANAAKGVAPMLVRTGLASRRESRCARTVMVAAGQTCGARSTETGMDGASSARIVMDHGAKALVVLKRKAVGHSRRAEIASGIGDRTCATEGRVWPSVAHRPDRSRVEIVLSNRRSGSIACRTASAACKTSMPWRSGPMVPARDRSHRVRGISAMIAVAPVCRMGAMISARHSVVRSQGRRLSKVHAGLTGACSVRRRCSRAGMIASAVPPRRVRVPGMGSVRPA